MTITSPAQPNLGRLKKERKNPQEVSLAMKKRATTGMSVILEIATQRVAGSRVVLQYTKGSLYQHE